MESELRISATRAWLRCVLPALLLLPAAQAWAQAANAGPKAGIYRCEINGKRLTSDRYIPECSHVPQQVLNADGSVKTVVPPTLTTEERAEAEARERERQAERARCQEAIRRDRNLMARFPNEAAHRKAREAALDDVRTSVRVSEARVKLLMAERKPLLDEAEFYVGKQLPTKLKGQIDANDAALDAQRTLIANQEIEVGRINSIYDAELVGLRKLWAGAPVGSLGSCGNVASGTAAAPAKATGR
jgi:hypothetical protein